jgi:ketosteroid isomerase-like protein
MEITELVARETIRDLVAAYAHGADRGRFDEVAALFTPDGTLELPDGRRMVGAAAIRTFLAGTTGTTGMAAAKPSSIRHHVSSHRIMVQGDEATGYAYFLVVTDRGPDHWGRYADRYLRASDGRWLFAARRVRVDGRAATSSPA